MDLEREGDSRNLIGDMGCFFQSDALRVVRYWETNGMNIKKEWMLVKPPQKYWMILGLNATVVEECLYRTSRSWTKSLNSLFIRLKI